MTEDFCDLIRLIRSLQRLEGNPDCFGTAGRFCGRAECTWREYCLKPEGATEPGPGEDPPEIHG
jgi:hypothetical protein